MTDLDKLSDSDLSQVFANEVSGWPPIRAQGDEGHPIYAKHFDLVCPYLGMDYDVDAHRDMTTGEPVVTVTYFGDTKYEHEQGTSSTIARAACIALIKAKRAALDAAKAEHRSSYSSFGLPHDD